jgi:hypothetical protein
MALKVNVSGTIHKDTLFINTLNPGLFSSFFSILEGSKNLRPAEPGKE